MSCRTSLVRTVFETTTAGKSSTIPCTIHSAEETADAAHVVTLTPDRSAVRTAATSWGTLDMAALATSATEATAAVAVTVAVSATPAATIAHTATRRRAPLEACLSAAARIAALARVGRDTAHSCTGSAKATPYSTIVSLLLAALYLGVYLIIVSRLGAGPPAAFMLALTRRDAALAFAPRTGASRSGAPTLGALLGVLTAAIVLDSAPTISALLPAVARATGLGVQA